MSTTIHDIIETEKSSSCCGSSMYELGDSYICTDCKEYCEAVRTDESDDRAFSWTELEIIREKEAACAKVGCEDTHKCV